MSLSDKVMSFCSGGLRFTPQAHTTTPPQFYQREHTVFEGPLVGINIELVVCLRSVLYLYVILSFSIVIAVTRLMLAAMLHQTFFLTTHTSSHVHTHTYMSTHTHTHTYSVTRTHVGVTISAAMSVGLYMTHVTHTYILTHTYIHTMTSAHAL